MRESGNRGESHRQKRYELLEYVFSENFPATQQPLYLDTCFASAVLLMTAIDQILPARLSLISYPAITESHPWYTEIDATGRNRRLRRYARASNPLSRARPLSSADLFYQFCFTNRNTTRKPNGISHSRGSLNIQHGNHLR